MFVSMVGIGVVDRVRVYSGVGRHERFWFGVGFWLRLKKCPLRGASLRVMAVMDDGRCLLKSRIGGPSTECRLYSCIVYQALKSIVTFQRLHDRLYQGGNLSRRPAGLEQT
jgi:hypothetical protein